MPVSWPQRWVSSNFVLFALSWVLCTIIHRSMASCMMRHLGCHSSYSSNAVRMLSVVFGCGWLKGLVQQDGGSIVGIGGGEVGPCTVSNEGRAQATAVCANRVFLAYAANGWLLCCWLHRR